MAEYLIVSDAVSPVAEGESALAAAGLARALVAAKHRVTLLSLGAAAHVATLPGMARRLRTVDASVAGTALDLPLFEGRVALGQVQLYVLGAVATPGADRGRTCSILATAAAALVRDALIKPDVVIGWGETAAASLSTVGASLRLFVLPEGTVGPPLSVDERADLGSQAALEALAADSLVALGVAGADVVVVPSPSSLQALEREPALAAGHASDQPIVAVRFGCDELPHDPAGDPALPATFTPDAMAGRAECRRALARRASLALGSRTLLLATGPLDASAGGKAVLEALSRLVRLDVAIAVASGGDRALTDRAAVLGIEHPGKLAVLPQVDAPRWRAVLAGADAVLLTATDDHTGRAAGIAMRYGAMPIVPEVGADADYLVDYDPGSATGNALLYSSLDPFEIEAAVRRALTLRGDPDAWQALARSQLLSAPRWASAAALIELMQPATIPEVPTAVAADVVPPPPAAS